MRLVVFPASTPRTSSHQLPVQHVSLPKGAASGTVLRPCSPAALPTTWTLKEELAFGPRAAGHRHRAQCSRSQSPFARERLAWLIDFSPVTKITKPCFFLCFCSCLGPVDCACCLVDVEDELLQMDPGCVAVAFPHGTEGFD